MRELATQIAANFQTKEEDRLQMFHQIRRASSITTGYAHAPAAPSEPLNMTQLNNMRSLMLILVELTANGEFNKARVAFNMAEGMLKDMDKSCF